MGEVRGVPQIAVVERVLTSSVGVNRYGLGWAFPVMLYGMAEEFDGLLLSHKDVSMAQVWAWLEEQIKVTEAGRDGGVWGVFLDGRGCFLIEWLLAQVFKLESARADVADWRVLLAMTDTAIHEQWGHGLLGATTARGRESGALQTQRYRRARHPRQSVTSTDGVILREKWDTEFNSTRFANEGWAIWMEREARSLGPAAKPSPPPLTAAAVRTDARRPICGARSPAEALEAVVDSSAGPDTAQVAMAVWEEAEPEIEEAFLHIWGQPPRSIVGHAVCSAIARRLGTALEPAAPFVAFHARCGIERHSVADFEQVITQTPSLNVNRRPGELAHVPDGGAVAGDARAMARAAPDHFAYAIPEAPAQ